MEKKFFERCRRCVFYDRRCGDVSSCIKSYIKYGNDGMVVIDCKLNKTENGTFNLNSPDEG